MGRPRGQAQQIQESITLEQGGSLSKDVKCECEEWSKPLEIGDPLASGRTASEL